MNTLRRNVLKSAGGASVIAVAVAAGLLKPTAVMASPWNKAAFEAKEMTEVLKNLGATGAAESKAITIRAPDIAENGAVVPVEVTSTLPDTTNIAIVVEKNATPLAGSFTFAGGAPGYVSTRVKMANSSPVRAIVTAGGKQYTAAKEVKVTVGGCGG